MLSNQDLAAEFQPSTSFYDQIIDPRKRKKKKNKRKKKSESEDYNGNHDRAVIVVAGTASL